METFTKECIQTEMGITFTLRSPNPAEKRARFSIFRVDRDGSAKRLKAVKSEELDLINSHYLSGTYNFQEARALAADIRKKFDIIENGQKYKPLTCNENMRLFESYWEKDYIFRELVDPESMRNDMLRALRVVGQLPLISADQTDLQKRIKESGLPNNKKRRIISRLNQLLKFAGRKFTLKSPKTDYLKIRYLSKSQIERLAGEVGGDIGNLILIAFATGARLGEIFGLQANDFSQDNLLRISRQLRRDGEIAQTKNRKERAVCIMDFGIPPLRAWIKTPLSRRIEIRNTPFSVVIRKTCQKLWPKEKDKHITFHDLRHSFAIEMLRLGESISLVSQLLGDSVQVCQTYYTGFSVAEESLAALSARLRSQEKK